MNSQSSDLKSDQYKMIVNSKSKIPPLQTPLKNRLQTLFVLLHSTSMCVFCCLYFLGWCVPYFWPLMLHYTIWYYLLDRSPVNGGVFERRSEWFRNLKLWKILVGYFPIELHKMQDLKPTFETTVGDGGKLIEKRIGPTYIFGYHPHGIIATGVACGFTNNGAGFAQIFPGIKCFVTTLVNQFRIPFYRDYLMAMGVTTVVKQNLKLLINKGASVVIVVGGARESLLAKPGLNSLVLNKRKGFIKLALESIEERGICVVPVYGFGENDIYDVFSTVETFSREKNNHHIEGEFENQDSNHNSNIVIRNFIRNTLHRFQLFLKDNFGFTLPIVISRGVFNYDFGILPYRKPINVVFGKPLNIERLDGLKYGDEVTQREIDYWHGKYVEELKKVWEWGSPQFSYPGDQELNILE